MNRKIYITNDILNLSEYIADLDDIDNYNCWSDPETQKGYNFKFISTIEEFKKGARKSRFTATNYEVY